jgi:hypothetical protein
VDASPASSMGFEEERDTERNRGRPLMPSSITLSLCLLLLLPPFLGGGVPLVSSSDGSLFLLRPRSSPVDCAARLSCCDVPPDFPFPPSSPHLEIKTGSTGLSFLSTETFAILCSVSSPEMTLPKTVCFPFRCGQGSNVMKNLPLDQPCVHVLIRRCAY